MARLRTIDPASLAPIARMELVARQAVEGFLTGRHKSPFHGSSVEYADHRPYTDGDEIRSLDWKQLAKTDKYYVKLYEDQTNLRCTVLLDVSRSMGFRGQIEGPRRPDKLTYASHLAAALGYLMLRQNDAIGLGLIDEQLRRYLPARAKASHFRRILAELQAEPAQAASRLGPVIHELAGRLKRRGMVVLISDLLDEPDQLIPALAHLRHRKHEVLVFHVMDPDEVTFPYQRLTRFRDMEGAGMVVADPGNIRQRYLDRLSAFLGRIKKGCHENDVTYELARTDQPWDQLLGAFLARRSRVGG